MCVCNPHPAPSLPSNKARQGQLGRSWSARTPDGWQLQLQLSCLGVTTLLGWGWGPPWQRSRRLSRLMASISMVTLVTGH